MLTIFKRKESQFWQIRGTVRVGRKIKTITKESTGTSNKAEARRICDMRHDQIKESFLAVLDMTWEECFERMLENPKHHPSKERMSIFERVRKLAGKYELNEFNDDLIFRLAYEQHPVLKQWKGKKLRDLPYAERQLASSKNNTANTCFIMPISKVLHYGAKQGWCNDPTIEHFEVLNARARHKEIFSVEDVKAIEEKCTDEHIKFLFIFLIYSGCRISEALNMNWNETNPENDDRPMIDLENDELNIFMFKTQEWITKPMHKKIREYLERINYREEKLFEWNHLHDRQNNPSGIPTRWWAMCQQAGVKYKNRHACRHTHASWLGKKASLQSLMTAVGWKSPKVALGYVKTDRDEVKQMINGLPE